MLDAADLEHLRCPLTQGRLHPGPDGATVGTEDGQIRYPVIDGVICLTAAAAQGCPGSADSAERLNPVAARLQRFYEDVGWKDSKTTDGEAHFEDAELFEDLRSVSADYIHRCHLRVRDHLPASGDLLLDAGSGPVQFPEYLTYQEGFRKRLCVDISLNALRQGRARLGERGIYVQGELTRLPIADQSIDAAVSLHTIYHVDADLQEQAILELHRVIKPGGRVVIMYSWKQTPLWRIVEGPNAVKLRWQRLTARLRGGAGIDDEKHRENAGLYFHPHSVGWFLSRPWPFTPRLAVWRFASVNVLKLYVHPWLGGRRLLRALFTAEQRWPEQLARHAAYPIILIDRISSERGAPR